MLYSNKIANNNEFIMDIENSVHYSLLDNKTVDTTNTNNNYYKYIIIIGIIFFIVSAIVIYICTTIIKK